MAGGGLSPDETEPLISALRTLVARLSEVSPLDPGWGDIEAIADALLALGQTKAVERSQLNARLWVQETLGLFHAQHEAALRFHELAWPDEWKGGIPLRLGSLEEVATLEAGLQSIAELLDTYQVLSAEPAPNKSRAKEIRDQQEQVEAELGRIHGSVYKLLCGKEFILPQKRDGSWEEGDPQATQAPDKQQPAVTSEDRSSHEEVVQGSEVNLDSESEEGAERERKDRSGQESGAELEGQSEAESEDDPDLELEVGPELRAEDEAESEQVGQPAENDVIHSIPEFVVHITEELQRADVRVEMLWPAIRWVDKSGATEARLMPTPEVVEAAFVLEQFQVSRIPAHRERLEHLIGAADAREGISPQQAAAVVVTAGAAVLIAGTNSVGWASGAILAEDLATPPTIAAWFREVEILSRLISTGVPGYPLDLAFGQDDDRRHAAIATQLETLFQQLRNHVFPFRVGNRFLRVAFPTNGPGRLDFILEQAKVKQPDLQRLKRWHEEFSAREFMSDVLRQVRGPHNDEAEIRHWAERYILDRLEAIHGAVGHLVGTSSGQHDDRVGPIVDEVRVLRSALPNWCQELDSVQMPDEWTIARRWALRVFGTVARSLERGGWM